MKPMPFLTDLSSAQDLAWLHQDPPPATSREAVGRLLETARLSLDAFDRGQLIAAQSLLEDTLIQILVGMRSLDINPDQALQRGLTRLRGTSASHRAFHIYADRVEIRVHGEIRGAWPLFSQADYDGALVLAGDLGCDIIHEEACQLGLFDRGNVGASSPVVSDNEGHDADSVQTHPARHESIAR
jgi:hypothetical protein